VLLYELTTFVKRQACNCVAAARLFSCVIHIAVGDLGKTFEKVDVEIVVNNDCQC